MGLDIYFELGPALKAGLKTKIDVEDYSDMGGSEELVHLMMLEGAKYWRDFSTIETNGKLIASVRANEWGSSYEPLTKFLNENSIEYYEA